MDDAQALAERELAIGKTGTVDGNMGATTLVHAVCGGGSVFAEKGEIVPGEADLRIADREMPVGKGRAEVMKD